MISNLRSPLKASLVPSSRKLRSSFGLAVTASVALCAAFAAQAQDNNGPLPMQSAPLATPGVPGLLPGAMPGAAQPNPLAQSGLPQAGPPRVIQGPPSADQLRDPSSAGAAPMPPCPPGGFAVVPGSKTDVTQRASVAKATDCTDSYAKTADQAIGQMTGNGMSMPEVTGQSDLAQLQNVQRQIQLYQAKAQLAEIVVKYWGVVYNNEHAKAWRDEERKRQDIEDKKAEKEAAAADAKAVALQSSTQPRVDMAQSAPLPQVYEIMNGVARVLVPGSGLVTAHSGTTLPDGTKVVAIGSDGVVAERNGHRATLAFVDSASAKR